MFRSTQTAVGHNSTSISSASHSSKLLVTRRSWLAGSTWAKFPTICPDNSTKSRYLSVDENESPAAWGIGDLVDVATEVETEKLGGVDQVDQARLVYQTPQGGHPSTDLVMDDHTSLKQFLATHGFKASRLVFFIFSIIAYVSDVGSDIYLVYTYYRHGDYYWSGLTSLLLIVPSLTMTIFSLVWYVLDRKANTHLPCSCGVWTMRLFFHGLQLAPLVRMTEAIYYGVISRKPETSLVMAVFYTQLMLYEDADSAMLRMIECFMEAAPQLLLQLYIIFTQESPVQRFQVIVQVVSCFTSWLSLAWSLTNYQSALRSSRVEKSNLTWSGFILFFCWKAGMLASRILSLALLAAMVRGLWFGVVIGIHWVFAVGWLITHGTTFCSPVSCTFTEYVFDVILGAVYCFDVINVREGHSRLFYLFCYLVIGLENMLIVTLWYISSSNGSNGGQISLVANWLTRTPNLSSWLRRVPVWLLPLVALNTFAFGLIMMSIYYMFAHPSGKIKIWISCDALVKCTLPSSTDQPVNWVESDQTEPPEEDNTCTHI